MLTGFLDFSGQEVGQSLGAQPISAPCKACHFVQIRSRRWTVCLLYKPISPVAIAGQQTEQSYPLCAPIGLGMQIKCEGGQCAWDEARGLDPPGLKLSAPPPSVR